MDRFMTVTKQTYTWPPPQKPIRYDDNGPINDDLSGPIIKGINDWYVEGNIPTLNKDVYPEEVKPTPAMLVKMRQLPGCVCWKGQIPKLEDPPIYPSRVGAAPEVDTSRYDQPNTYLRLLYEKYPYLYNVLQHIPAKEIIENIQKDTLRTTYQRDFDIKSNWPKDEKEQDQLLEFANIPKKKEVYTPTKIPKRDYRPKPYDPIIKEKILHEGPPESKNQKNEDYGPSSMIPENNFESVYHKDIGELGCEIIKRKLFSKKTR